MGGECSMHGELKNSYKTFVGKPKKDLDVGGTTKLSGSYRNSVGGCGLRASGSG